MIKVILRDGGYYDISEEQIELWGRLYDSLDIVKEIKKLRDGFEDKTIPRQSAASINKYINRYLKDRFLRERYKI